PKRGSADLDALVDRRLHALAAYRNDLQQRRELAQPGQALLRGLPERAAREALRPLARDHEALAVGIEEAPREDAAQVVHEAGDRLRRTEHPVDAAGPVAGDRERQSGLDEGADASLGSRDRHDRTRPAVDLPVLRGGLDDVVVAALAVDRVEDADLVAERVGAVEPRP